jgi:dTDP-4-dehydrorhamnose reductase
VKDDSIADCGLRNAELTEDGGETASQSGGRAVVLVTGGNGQVGWELVRALAPLGRVVAPGREEMDLGSGEQIREVVRALRPAVIVNAAAYTAVDRAESEPELARAINATAPGILAEEAARLGALLVHYSTDYVFDGSGDAPYTEAREPSPINVYGETKLAGELAVQGAGGPYLILRTSWVYGARGTNFVRTMLRLARERDELRVVDDQVGAPTWSRMIAEATAQIVGRVGFDAGGLSRMLSGVYHLTASGTTSWFGFAKEILALDPAREEQCCRSVVPITSDQYPTPARRPRYSVLDNSRIASQFGLHLPHWKTQLELLLAEGRAL